jgi:acyl-CoA thioesterase FadM
MYPVLRMVKEFAVFRNAPLLGLMGTHVSYHICWPWDIDLWWELNNGRTLTFYDLGRLVLAKRIGFIALLKQNGWGMTVAGTTIRYRARVKMFDKVQLRSRVLGWDDKFIYIEQSMWKGDTCTSGAVLRMAVIDGAGLVRMDRVTAALQSSQPPEQPAWINTWTTSEHERPWPPDMTV